MRTNFRKNIIYKLASCFMMSVLFFSCIQKAEELDMSPYDLETRSGWPNIYIPENNLMSKASVDFGKQLFFDKRLSVDTTISCANCHKPEYGFADAIPFSTGIDGQLGFRNSGSLTNVAYLPYFNRDGGVRSLDRFSLVPIEDHAEMNLNLLEMRNRLMEDESYVHQAETIYGRKPDAFTVSRAIASYLRTFISDDSLFDKYIYDGDSTAITASQKRGINLFFGDKAKCSACHNGINLTNYKFENNGLYSNYIGKDRGRQRITDNPKDEGKFRVASLRNIDLSAPYMHDGSLSDLQAVLDHYGNHGKPHKNKNSIIDQIEINDVDKKDIISFLKLLTDTAFINNHHFQPSRDRS